MIASTQEQTPITEFVSHSPDETFEYGRRIGAELRGGEILLLSGPLGAGKTILVKGIATALGIDRDDVTSPTFTLVNPYAGTLTLFHIDLYRLDEAAAAAHAIDLQELLSDPSAVLVIEWAERLGQYPWPTTVARITIAGDGDEPRKVRIERSC